MIFHQPRLAELAIFAALLRLPGTAPYTIPESVPLKKKSTSTIPQQQGA